MPDDKAFGGARVIYVGTPIKKETAQSNESSAGDVVGRPYHSTNGDLITYWSNLPDLNSYHARCLTIKAGTSVGLGFTIKDIDEARIREELAVVNAHGHSLTEVLVRVALDYESAGNGYLEVVRGKGGAVVELYHMPARYAWRIPLGREAAFRYEEDTVRRGLPAFSVDGRDDNSIIHFSQPTNLSRYYGAPDWRGCVQDIELDYYAVLYNQKFFINSGIPDLAIVVKGGKLSPEDEAKVIAFFQSEVKGVSNSHKVLYIPIDDENVELKFEKLALDVKDRDGSFHKLRNQCRDNIVSAHGVPPRILGIVSAGALGGAGETVGQMKIFADTTINPRQTMYETKLSPVLAAMGFGAGEINFNEIDITVQEAASEYYPKMTEAGILDIDEARADLGYGPREEPLEEKPLELVKGLRMIKSRWDRQEVA